jgi:hypothetical protein
LRQCGVGETAIGRDSRPRYEAGHIARCHHHAVHKVHQRDFTAAGYHRGLPIGGDADPGGRVAKVDDTLGRYACYIEQEKLVIVRVGDSQAMVGEGGDIRGSNG